MSPRNRRTDTSAGLTQARLPRSAVPLRRWADDLRLGCRLALAGGRSAWVRLAMTAAGVGVGVAVLLLATSVPVMLQERDHRADARALHDLAVTDTVPPEDPDVDPLLVVDRQDSYHGTPVAGYVVQALGDAPPEAPGVARLPGPGEIVVSPALGALLARPDGDLLRTRLSQRVVGTIGPDGLLGPQELFYYVGTDELSGLAGRQDVETVLEFGGTPPPPSALNPLLLLLVSLGTASLLIPVVVFLGSMTRLAAEARDRRLAALRLVGAGAVQVRRIAAGEAFAGAVAGLGVGVALFLLGRALTPYLTQSIFGSGFFGSDLRPAWPLALALLVAVPLLAVGIAVLSLRRIVIEPLGVVRSAPVVRRRLWWRLVPFVLGGGLIATQLGPRGVENLVTVGIVLLLTGVPTLLPYVVERTASRLGGGPPSWQLAVRRLQLDSATSARIVGGVAAALAGAIALQTLFIPAEEEFTESPSGNAEQIGVDVLVGRTDEADRLVTALRGIDGTTAGPVRVTGSLVDSQDRYDLLHVAPCPVLRTMAWIAQCEDGDAYRVGPPGPRTADAPPRPRAGAPVWFIGNDDVGPPAPSQWTVPTTLAAARPGSDDAGAGEDGGTVDGGTDEEDGAFEGVLATPGALADARNAVLHVTGTLTPHPGQSEIVERVRNTVATFGWSARVSQPFDHSVDRTYAGIRQALMLGSLVILLLAALSLLVIALEQVRERRRPLAVLAAAGVQRSVLARSLLWQATVPVVLALGVALVAGFGLGTLLLLLSGKPVVFDWAGVATMTAASLGAVLLATVCTLPSLWRAVSPKGLRAE